LSELFSNISQDSKPDDAASVKATLLYLEACNKVFEQGLLSHDKVCDMNSKVIKSIKKGFSDFIKWHASLLKNGKYFYFDLLRGIFSAS